MSTLDEMQSELKALEDVREVMRDGLLAIMSQVRDFRSRISPERFEKLLDGVKRFHPDNEAGDLICDALFDVIHPLESEIMCAEEDIEIKADRQERIAYFQQAAE